MQRNQSQSRSPRRYLDARPRHNRPREEEGSTQGVRADAERRRDLEAPQAPTSSDKVAEERAPSPGSEAGGRGNRES